MCDYNDFLNNNFDFSEEELEKFNSIELPEFPKYDIPVKKVDLSNLLSLSGKHTTFKEFLVLRGYPEEEAVKISAEVAEYLKNRKSDPKNSPLKKRTNCP